MKPKTQRLPKKKQQEEAIKQAQLKSKIKPQPAPEKPVRKLFKKIIQFQRNLIRWQEKVLLGNKW